MSEFLPELDDDLISQKMHHAFINHSEKLASQARQISAPDGEPGKDWIYCPKCAKTTSMKVKNDPSSGKNKPYELEEKDETPYLGTGLLDVKMYVYDANGGVIGRPINTHVICRACNGSGFLMLNSEPAISDEEIEQKQAV